MKLDAKGRNDVLAGNELQMHESQLQRRGFDAEVSKGTKVHQAEHIEAEGAEALLPGAIPQFVRVGRPARIHTNPSSHITTSCC